ncbi:MAG: cytochrome P450 [Cyanobacteria bacterium SZAS LIN-3]|nr:cytochrome P450 [Cyanobacteria bacterium SZAS LIN-3]
MSSATEFRDPLFEQTDEFLQNPHAHLANLRALNPVLWSPRGQQWLITGHDEAVKILRSKTAHKTMAPMQARCPFANLGLRLAELHPVRSKMILHQDPPEHTRMRSLVNSAFAPKVVTNLEGSTLETAESLLNDIEKTGGGRCDLIPQYAFPLPVTVISNLLGVHARDRDKFHAWSSKLTPNLDLKFTPRKIIAAQMASNALMKYFKNLIKERRSDPREDLLSALVKVESANDGRLSEAELLANALLMLVAGHETTVNLIGNGVHALLAHPQQMQLLREKPELMGDAIEEILRYQSPVQLVRRFAHEDISVGDQTIRTGDLIQLLLGACNRDPREYSQPDTFDIGRGTVKHLAFSMGIHFCLGAELARMEGRVALGALLRRFPNLALADDAVLRYKQPFALRGLASLPVRF